MNKFWQSLSSKIIFMLAPPLPTPGKSSDYIFAGAKTNKSLLLLSNLGIIKASFVPQIGLSGYNTSINTITFMINFTNSKCVVPVPFMAI